MACSRRGAHPYDRAPRGEATALHDQWEAVIDPLSLVWLFFVVSSLQPLVQRQVLAARRRADRVRLSHKRQATVITSIHRQETMSLLGFPVVRYIDIDDAEGVLEAIPETAPGRAIEIILHTPGLALAARQIAQSPRAISDGFEYGPPCRPRVAPASLG